MQRNHSLGPFKESIEKEILNIFEYLIAIEYWIVILKFFVPSAMFFLCLGVGDDNYEKKKTLK